jgi:hypothetical protein
VFTKSYADITKGWERMTPSVADEVTFALASAAKTKSGWLAIVFHNTTNSPSTKRRRAGNSIPIERESQGRRRGGPLRADPWIG